MTTPGLLRLLGATVAAGFAGWVLAGSAQAGSCPPISFLSYDGGVYRGYTIPASVELEPGRALGGGSLDEPTGDDSCQRERAGVNVSAVVGVDPGVAVLVAARPRLAFVLGRACSGLEGAPFWRCLATPLVLEGRAYVQTAYPGRGEREGLPLGEPLAGAELGGEPATAVRIEGVEPQVAVALAGRPGAAFVAVGTCPYERFDSRPIRDDLRRCIEAPVWLVFDPPGELPGRQVTARADRPLPEGERIEVELAPSTAGGDVVPDDLAGAVLIGALVSTGDGLASFTFEVPDVDSGAFEAITRCETCAAERGRRMFPGGLFVVGEEGGSSTTIVLVAIAAVFVASLAAAVYVRRKLTNGAHGAGPDGRDEATG